MSKKKVAVIIGAVVVAAAAAAGIWYYAGNGVKDSKDRVYVEKVSKIMGNGTGAQNRYSGVVQPQKTVEVNTDSERTVKEVYVKVGDMVEEGTPLFCYDTEDLEMDLAQAKLELENQDIEISNYKNQISELQKEKEAAAEGDKFEYTTQIQTVQTQIKQAEYEKSSKNLEMEKIQKKIDNSEVVSTASGVVKTLNDSDSQDNPDSSSAFMTILATGEYRVKGVMNEQNAGMISAGVDVIVRSRVDEEIIWRGTVDSLDTGDPSSSSEDESMSSDSEDSTTTSSKYPFYVSLESADGLMLGQHVLIELDEGQTEKKDGIWLYSSYIVQEEETAYVWADDGNSKLIKRTVELGEYDEGLDEYEIKSGLALDDKIAWPMEGLYEGVVTVTNVDEVDYSSDLYNQEMGTEELWDGTEEGIMGDDSGMYESLEGTETMFMEDAGILDTEVSE